MFPEIPGAPLLRQGGRIYRTREDLPEPGVGDAICSQPKEPETHTTVMFQLEVKPPSD